ncbi:MAG: ABC transporter ATP-binding protein [Candidatus Hydrogenedentes bacterium]|nr:ABC transporter ATP-binding protein [Candidatus Hydrogenedentota bacterium]
MALLHAECLHKSFSGPNGKIHALDGVSLTLEPGDFLAVKGPSGCGKSTLLFTLGALLRPDAGDLTVLDRKPYAMSREERAALRAKSIGFVFQQFHLTPYLSVLDNVLAPALALPSVDARARASELIERVGLKDRADHVPSMLSTGERQRTALARALLNRPKILLADEPTGNLDEDNGALVLEHLSAFAKQGGAVVLVTHERDAAAHAHTILQMREGRLERLSL